MFAAGIAPSSYPRTETRTYSGNQTSVYTHHPSAGGAAQARPFSIPGLGRFIFAAPAGLADWRREAGLVGAAAPEVQLD